MSATLDDLANLFEETSDTQADVVKRARLYLDARKRKEECEEEQKRLNATLANCETELLRSMDAAGVKSLKVEHDGRTSGLTQTQSTYYNLPAGSLDEPGVIEWIEDSGGADLMKKTIHHATFSSFCKELIEKGTMKLNVKDGVIFLDGAACGDALGKEVANANGLAEAEYFVKIFENREFIVDDKLRILLHPSVKIAERRSIMVRKG